MKKQFGSFVFEFFVGDIIVEVGLGFFLLLPLSPGLQLQEAIFCFLFRKKLGKTPHL